MLIDEAHAMPVDTLEEIRLLSNLESNRHKLLQLVLFGQPELDATLARPDMRQLRERITHNFRLEPLVQEDIAEYLDFRMRAAGYRGPSVFTPAAVQRITKVSAGLTRRINILADKALLACFAHATHQVGSREIEAAIRDAEFSDLPKPARRSSTTTALLWAAGGAVTMLAVIGIWLYSTRPTEPPARAQATSAPPSPSQVVAPPPAPGPAAFPESASSTPLLDRLLEESHSRLETVADDRWFIQLFTAIDGDDPVQVEAFLASLRDAGLEMGRVRVYRLTLGDKSRYGVLFGDYASRQEAVEALNTLPAEVKRYRPYPRQALRIRLDGKPSNKG